MGITSDGFQGTWLHTFSKGYFMSAESQIPKGLPLELLQPWLDLKTRREALEYYFHEILSKVLAVIEVDPRHLDLRGNQYHTLISLMGYSPETTVICAAIIRPQKLIIVSGMPEDKKEREEIDFSYDTAVPFLTSRRILKHSQIQHVQVNPIDAVDIYRAVRSAIDQTPTINDNRSALVDVTGGKKVMSATAAQAAWEVRIPLCYVEGKFQKEWKRPWPGTESVIRLETPSRLRQVQMRIDALQLYANRNYPLAVEAFDRCRASRVENRLDEFASAVCRVYVRWSDLDLLHLKDDLRSAELCTTNERTTSLFGERSQSIASVRDHLAVLQRVADAEPLGMIATFLELADLYATDSFQRYDFACLLVYRGMEAIVEYGLRKCFGSDFPRKPRWEEIPESEALETKYVNLSTEIDGKGHETSLPSNVGFVNGLALLCLATKLSEIANMTNKSIIQKMLGVAKLRNESVLAHGVRTLTKKDFAEMQVEADRLAKWILGDSNVEVGQLRTGMQPLDLSPLHDESTH